MQSTTEAAPTRSSVLPPIYQMISSNDKIAPLAPPRKEPEDLATGSSNTALDLAEQLAEQLSGAFVEAQSWADVRNERRVRKMPLGIGKPTHGAALRWASNAHAAYAWPHGMVGVLQPLHMAGMPMHPWPQGW